MQSNVSITPREESVEPQKSGGCGCSCGSNEVPRLVARDLPGKVRHPAILGALLSLQSGDQLDLVAPHVPRPLLAQVEQAAPGAFQAEILSETDGECVVRFTRN